MAIDGRIWPVLGLLLMAWLGVQQFLQIGHNIGTNGVNATAPSGPPTIDGYPVFDGFVTKMGLETQIHPGQKTVTGWVTNVASFKLTTVCHYLDITPQNELIIHFLAGGTISELRSNTGDRVLVTITVYKDPNCKP